MIRSGDYLRYYATRQKRAGKATTCIQIGANDGIDSDPVREYFVAWGWHGVLAEPLPDVYEQLTANYAGYPNVLPVNVAIADKDGELPFYRVGSRGEAWATGLSSFRRDHVQAHIDRGYVAVRAAAAGVAVNYGDLIQEVPVQTRTFEGFLSEHDVEDFDVLVIDTEGYDHEILKLVDFGRHQPDVVLFESDNLTDQEYESALALLRAADYELRWSFLDTLAIRVPYPRSAATRAAARNFLPRARGKVHRTLRPRS